MEKSKADSRTTTIATVKRVQRAVANSNGGAVPKGSYVGRMQRIVKKHSGK